MANKDVLEHILKYTDEILATVERFGDSLETFCKDTDYHFELLSQESVKPDDGE